MKGRIWLGLIALCSLVGSCSGDLNRDTTTMRATTAVIQNDFSLGPIFDPVPAIHGFQQNEPDIASYLGSDWQPVSAVSASLPGTVLSVSLLNGFIYGTLISDRGEISNPNGFLIADSPDSVALADARRTGGFPAVASDGEQFLVLWFGLAGRELCLHGAFVSPAGSVTLISDPLHLPLGRATQGFFYMQDVLPVMKLAWGGGNYLLSWITHERDAVANNDTLSLRACRLTPTGESLDGQGILIKSDYRLEERCLTSQWSSQTQTWLLAYGEWYEENNSSKHRVRASILGGDGAVLQQDFCILPDVPQFSSLTLARGNLGYLLVLDKAYSGQTGIWATRLSFNGAVLDPQGILLSTWGSVPAVSFNGDRFFVAWGGSSSVYGTWLSEDGIVSNPNGVRLFTDGLNHPFERIAAFAVDSGFVMTWRRSCSIFRDYSSDIRFYHQSAWADRNGIVVGSVTDFDLAAQRTSNPGAAAIGKDFFLTWGDERDYCIDDVDIYARRLNDGEAMLRGGVSSGQSHNFKDRPVIAGNDRACLVAWWDVEIDYAHDEVLYRLMAELIFGDRERIALHPLMLRNFGPYAAEPVIATDGTNFLVAWYYNGSIKIQLVTADGGVDPRYADTIFTGYSTGGLALAWFAGDYWLLYGQNRIIYVRRIDASAVVDPEELALFRSDQSIGPLAVAATDTVLLVTWADLAANDEIADQLRAIRVSPNGQLLDAGPRLIGDLDGEETYGSLNRHSVAALENLFLIAWSKPHLIDTYTLDGVLLNSDGQMLGEGSLKLAESSRAIDSPAVGANQRGEFLIAWTSYDPEPSVKQTRVKARRLCPLCGD